MDTCAEAASILAFRSWEKTKDRSARTAPGRAEFRRKLERQADPDGVLGAEELAARVLELRSAYFRRLYNERLARQARGSH